MAGSAPLQRETTLSTRTKDPTEGRVPTRLRRKLFSRSFRHRWQRPRGSRLPPRTAPAFTAAEEQPRLRHGYGPRLRQELRRGGDAGLGAAPVGAWRRAVTLTWSSGIWGKWKWQSCRPRPPRVEVRTPFRINKEPTSGRWYAFCARRPHYVWPLFASTAPVFGFVRARTGVLRLGFLGEDRSWAPDQYCNHWKSCCKIPDMLFILEMKNTLHLDAF